MKHFFSIFFVLTYVALEEFFFNGEKNNGNIDITNRVLKIIYNGFIN